MGSQRHISLACDQTGVSIPECSCSQCIEMLLRRYQPELLSGPGPDQLGFTADGIDDPGVEHRLAA